MSRFRLFSMMAAMIAAMSNNESNAVKETSGSLAGKQMRMQGDYGSAYYGGKQLNQRQRRKLERQVPQRRNRA